MSNTEIDDGNRVRCAGAEPVILSSQSSHECYDADSNVGNESYT